ncbi:hypothetical protein ACOSP7_000370 [Xanthoceras sorbifolium]
MDAHYSVKGAILTGRYTPPTHYLLIIESFSKLTKAIVNKYSSDKFDAEGFSWKLSIYPTGDKSKNGEGHISIYLELDTSLAVGTDVNVIINLFVFNHLEDRYLSFQDNHMYSSDNYSSGRVEFLSLAKLEDPKMGFLVDDIVIIEAEVTLLGLVMKE